MNQILVTEKLIVTPEFRKKGKIYRFNFFLSIFLACTLFSCYIYAEYDRSKSEQVSQELLLSIQEEDDTLSTVSVDNDVLVVTLSENPSNTKTEIKISDLVKGTTEEGNAKSKLVEATASDGTKYYLESVLTISKLGIEYPVLSDTSDELLKTSLNKLWGPNPNQVGNYVIIGHNYKSGKMFGKLSNIEAGDTCELKDLATGKVVTYKVYDKYIIDPTDTRCTTQKTNGKREITLITCHNSGKQRLVVKAIEI